jgi:radical SAM protein with 4Fe4S-binding SPASM domain
MTDFIDPSIQRKSNLVDNSLEITDNGIPLPSVVEISESGTCNRSCAFCPRSDLNFPDIKEFISTELVEKLSRQLRDVGYKGIFLFSGFVEPLLDKNIFHLVSTVQRNLPLSRIEMVTNGDALNGPRLRRLFDNGLSTLLISVYDGPEEEEHFRNLCIEVGLEESQYVIRNRYLPEEETFGITLSNRSGMMEDAEFSVPSAIEPLKVSCHYPHYTFFMDYLGDVLLCPHDWGKKYIAGNMQKSDFMEIWSSSRMAAARARLAAADRYFSPCDKCDVKGTLMGAKHVSAWEKQSKLKGLA